MFEVGALFVHEVWSLCNPFYLIRIDEVNMVREIKINIRGEKQVAKDY